MDILFNLTNSHDKLDLNISTKINSIIDNALNINKLLDDTNNMVINYINEDLICLNNISLHRIDNIKYDFMDEIQNFILNLKDIDNNNIDTYVMNELKNIIINQELSILRLDNLLDEHTNKYIKETKLIINKYIDEIFKQNDVYDKIYSYINKYHDDIIKKFINELNTNSFLSGNIDNIIMANKHIINIENIEQIEHNIKDKYKHQIEICLNTDNYYKWNNDLVLYEINTPNNNKKIYIYLDLNIRDGKIENRDIIDIDISKIFCINNNNANLDINKIYNYMCDLIDKFIV